MFKTESMPTRAENRYAGVDVYDQVHAIYTGIQVFCPTPKSTNAIHHRVLIVIIQDIIVQKKRLNQGLSAEHSLTNLLNHVLAVLLSNKHNTTTALAHTTQTA